MTTGASALDPGLTAVITALVGDATYAALCAGGTFDATPQGVRFPYAWVTVREDPRPMETFGAMGFELEWRLQVFRKDDVRETTQVIDQILGRAAVVLHHATLSLTGFTLEHLHYLGAFPLPALRDADGSIIRTKVGIFRGLAVAS